MVFTIRDKEIPTSIDCHIERHVQCRHFSGSPVTQGTVFLLDVASVAGDGRDDLCDRVNPPNSIVNAVGVGDEEITP